MKENLNDFEDTLNKLKSSSKASLTMVILGALLLLVSLIYSATRLSPLEEQIKAKTKIINDLEKTETKIINDLEKTEITYEQKINDLITTELTYKEKIVATKKEYEELKSNVEQLYAVRVTSNNQVFELKATAKATGVSTSNGPAYDFYIYINAPKATLENIKKVNYLFDHPTFNEKHWESSGPETNFMTKYYGWGCLTKVSARLEMKNGSTQDIEFNMCQSLGPLWWDQEDNSKSEVSRNLIRNDAPLID